MVSGNTGISLIGSHDKSVNCSSRSYDDFCKSAIALKPAREGNSVTRPAASLTVPFKTFRSISHLISLLHSSIRVLKSIHSVGMPSEVIS